MKTPVAFLIFKRPEVTEKVFQAISQAKPPKLLVVADGPRHDRPGESEKCAATRAIIDRVDWDCEVLKNYSDVNLGCKQRVSSGLNWVFDTVEEAIILEDDCLPDPTFFQYCEELLNKYRDDKRIMTICGTNTLIEWQSDIQSYHFAYFSSLWGWASWKRAWQYYDIEMKLWLNPQVQNRIRDVIANHQQYLKIKQFFDSAYSDRVDTWGYRWHFTRLSQSGLSIVPSVNLVSNFGATEGAAHAIETHPTHNLLVSPMSFPLKHPPVVAVDREADRRHYQKSWTRSLPERISRKIQRLVASK